MDRWIGKNLEETKKTKIKKKQYFKTLAKVKMQKSKKPRENQKKNKNKQYSRSLEIGSIGKSPGILFFVCFFGFSQGFLDFGFLILQKSWNMFFFGFSFGFLEVFGVLLLQESWNIVFFLVFWFS